MAEFLRACRKLIWLPIIGSIALTLGGVIFGIGRIVTGLYMSYDTLDFSSKAGKSILIYTLETLDIFLVATVAYITAVGLYKLFLNPDYKLPGLLVIRNLNELESKIIGVVVAALAVAFLGETADEEATDLMNIGFGIAGVILSLAVFVSLTSGKNKPGLIDKQKDLGNKTP